MLFKKYANTKYISQIHEHPTEVLKTYVLVLHDTDNYSVYYSRGEKNPWRHVAPATELCTVAPNICGTSALNLLHVTFLASRILLWLLDFWNICATVYYPFFILFV
jgi:hypothetical protein